MFAIRSRILAVTQDMRARSRGPGTHAPFCNCAGGRSAAIGIRQKSIKFSARHRKTTCETSLVGSNDRVGSSEPEPPAGLPAGKGREGRGARGRKGDPDRQKVLTYRQVDARVHSNIRRCAIYGCTSL